ncbi:GNAT family N-acetyltransferase [uncultured Rubinisphaera sp.]|uniref:GNAT family N-acetyltransferase n=1 Tax=uncultured Rubinisphaera sp. TaxID=1678686 RepID=UPI0030D8BCF5
MSNSSSSEEISGSTHLQSYDRAHSSILQIDENYHVEVVDSISGLLGYLEDWHQLIPNCSISNAFYEPYFLLTALQKLHHEPKLRFVFVYRQHNQFETTNELCGFFPLESAQIEMYPRSGWKLITNSLSFSCDPLIRAGFENEAISSFLKWSKWAHCSIIEFPCVSAEGVFHSAIKHALNGLGITPFIVKTSQRACLRRDSQHLETLNVRRDINRKRRRLAEQGQLDLRILKSPEQLANWQNGFLSLEERGWKGSKGTALNQNPSQRSFFLTATRQAFERSKLQMFGLFLDGNPIAFKCNLISGSTGYAWKIAFDEDYARYSPGLLLEYDFIDYFRNQPELDVVDSCAAPGHPLFARIWPDLHSRQTILVPTGILMSKMYCSSRPLLRSLKRTLLVKSS